MRKFRPNLVIEDRDEMLVAMVAIEGSVLSREDTVEIRSSMLERGLPPHVPYFLMLSCHVGFLWKYSPSLKADSPPDYEFPMQSVIDRHAQGATHILIESVLEYVFLEWLLRLSFKPQEGEFVDEPEKTLARASFMDAIKNTAVFIGDL